MHNTATTSNNRAVIYRIVQEEHEIDAEDMSAKPCLFFAKKCFLLDGWSVTFVSGFSFLHFF